MAAPHNGVFTALLAYINLSLRSHVLPHIINLLANREYCVRLVLLKHFELFAGLCSHDDLTTIILPEVNKFKHDTHLIYVCL